MRPARRGRKRVSSGKRMRSKRPTKSESRYGQYTRKWRPTETSAKRSAMSSPTPIGGRNRPMPTAAGSTGAKGDGGMAVWLGVGETEGVRPDAAGGTSRHNAKG